jgi:hypothetical protein
MRVLQLAVSFSKKDTALIIISEQWLEEEEGGCLKLVEEAR